MATLGVLAYSLPPGLKLKNTNLSKISITTGSGVAKAGSPLKMIGSEVGNMRKKQKLQPLCPSNADNIQKNLTTQPPAKKPKLAGKVLGLVASSPTVAIATPGRKTSNMPQAVARRNARERNRVKQVNNGFAALRQHIPEEVAEAFEAAGNGRGSAKKLSKVETLRMAVEYIRSLERLLGLENQSPMSDDSMLETMIKSELSDYGPISPMDDQYEEDNSNYDPDESGVYYTDNLPDVTQINGQQYLRIPGTNTYQLITTEVFENEENFQPMIMANCAPSGLMPPASPPSGLAAVVAPAPNSVAAISPQPQQTSPASLSPAATADDDRHRHQQYLMSQLQMPQIKMEPSSNLVLYRAPNFTSSSPIDGPTAAHGQGYFHDERQLYDECIITVKKEARSEDNGGATVILDTSTAVLSDESIMEAIDWWDAHTPKSDNSSIIM